MLDVQEIIEHEAGDILPDATWDEIFNKTEGALHSSFISDSEEDDSCCNKDDGEKVTFSIDLTHDGDEETTSAAVADPDGIDDHDFITEKKVKRKVASEKK